MRFINPGWGLGRFSLLIGFSKAFHSVWHSAFFHKLVSTGFPHCLVRWIQSSFLIRALALKITKIAPFKFVDLFHKDSFLALYFFLFSNDLPPFLPASISCSLYADNLAIWSSSTSVFTAMDASQRALIQLECCSEYWCLLFSSSKCEASSVDLHQADL